MPTPQFQPRSPIIVPTFSAGEWAWFWKDARFVVPFLDLGRYRTNVSFSGEIFAEEIMSRAHSTHPNSLQVELREGLGPVVSSIDAAGHIEWLSSALRTGTITRPWSCTLLVRTTLSGTRFIVDSGNGFSVVQFAARWEMRAGGSTSTTRVATANTTLLEDGDWHLLTFVADAGDDRVYIDGDRHENTDTTSGDPGALATDVALFATTTNSFNWRGDIGFCVMLNTGVSDIEARQWSRDWWGPFRQRPNPFGRSLAVLAAIPPVRNRFMAS